jgi:hypothetical protein
LPSKKDRERGEIDFFEDFNFLGEWEARREIYIIYSI